MGAKRQRKEEKKNLLRDTNIAKMVLTLKFAEGTHGARGRKCMKIIVRARVCWAIKRAHFFLGAPQIFHGQGRPHKLRIHTEKMPTKFSLTLFCRHK